MLISVAAAVLFIVNIWRRGWVFPIIAVGLWGFISIVVGTIYPAVIQRFAVQPNEFSREQPYIERNITATRAAFGLDKIDDRRTFDYDTEARRATRRRERGRRSTTCGCGIRRPRARAFQVRPRRFDAYYEFIDVDVDRYEIGAEKSQAHDVGGARARPGAPARQLVDEPAPRVHARLRRRRRSRPTQAAGDARATCSATFRRRGRARAGPTSTRRRVLRRGRSRATRSSARRSPSRKRSGDRRRGDEVHRRRRREVVELRCARPRSRCASATGTCSSRASSRTSRASLYIRDIQERVETAAPFLQFDDDPYPVVLDGTHHRGWSTRTRRPTDYPYSQSIHPDDADGQRARHRLQLRAQLGEGDRRRVRRHGALLRRRRRRTRSSRRTARRSRELFSDVEEMPAGSARALALPRRPLQRADRAVHAVPHDRPGAVLPQAGHLGHRAEPEQADRDRGVDRAPQSGNDGGRNTTLAATGKSDRPAVPDDAATRRETEQEFVLQRAFVPRRKGESSRRSSWRAHRRRQLRQARRLFESRQRRHAPSPAQAASAIESDTFISQQFSLLDQRRFEGRYAATCS